ncbi:hypothetical protein BH10CYA1_BH10CYA1_17730 [soil metagenome]
MSQHMTVYIAGKPYTFDPDDVWKEGGEAYIYKYGSDALLRYYRRPDDIRFAGTTPEDRQRQHFVELRLEELQRKLPVFPKNLPERVVTDRELVWNSIDQRSRPRIVGSIVPLIPDAVTLHELASAKFRRENTIGDVAVIDILKDLYATVCGVHKADAVIGDFNTENVLVQPSLLRAPLVDAHAMQFGSYLCATYTARYVDPLVARWAASKVPGEPGSVEMIGRHSPLTDWYAYHLMFWEMWYAPLYGGVYRPKTGATMVEFEERPFHSPRLSVLHPDVAYPKRGFQDYHTAPPEILEHYRNLVTKDLRAPFPEKFLDNLRVAYGGTYLATHTPVPAVPVGISIIRSGPASSTLMFETTGTILDAAYHGGRLRFLCSKDGRFYREGARTKGDLDIGKGSFNPKVAYIIQGDSTILAKEGGKATLIAPGAAPLQLDAERYRQGKPVVATNENFYYWAGQGKVRRKPKPDPQLAMFVTPQPVEICEALQEQTRIWVGPKFGFAFSATANFAKAFVFDAEKAGNLPVDLEPLSGNIVAIRCYFSDDRLWLFTTKKVNGSNVNKCTLIDSNGKRLAASKTVADGDDSWLGSIDGKCAALLPAPGGKIEALLSVTADGVVLVQQSGVKLSGSSAFEGTATLVNADDNLFYSPDGLYAWNSNSIRLIKTS